MWPSAFCSKQLSTRSSAFSRDFLSLPPKMSTASSQTGSGGGSAGASSFSPSEALARTSSADFSSSELSNFHFTLTVPWPISKTSASNQLFPNFPSTVSPTAMADAPASPSLARTSSVGFSSSESSKPHFTLIVPLPISTTVASNQLFPYFPSTLSPTAIAFASPAAAAPSFALTSFLGTAAMLPSNFQVTATVLSPAATTVAGLQSPPWYLASTS
mmetsp:Transcript_30075/g.52846  ORF Transcript_30075/g.52846 Transcript_30075/m.52846 type:complete len:216 (-) Transcript_30075:904-1551(-)